MNTNLNQLNPSQQKAVDFDKGHLLIVAGPGTGKTHTLTHRIARLLDQLDEGKKILAVTFTNKAAEEMSRRLRRLTPNRSDSLIIGTFHQFCLRVLRERYPQNFSVISPEEVLELTQDIWPGDSKKQQKEKLNHISHWKSTVFEEKMPDEVRDYNRLLRKKELFDFDDLLIEILKLLQENQELVRDFSYIFVDEYQDINPLQRALLKLLVRESVTITAIGDPNQSIYGFRGSDVRIFQNFKEDFPGASVLKLSENYRSTQNLLSASQQMISQNNDLHVPALTANLYEQGRLRIHTAPTDKAEAEYVVHMIEKMIGGTSMFSQDSGRVESEEMGEVSFGDIAVLYRLNSQSRELIKAFERSGMPYHVSRKAKNDELDDICPERSQEVTTEAERISLMTLHAAKGLEFSAVFIIGCEETLLPLNLGGMQAEEQEERRLFYVGMTRAKKALFLLNARRRFIYGKTYQNNPSPFLADIEEQLKEYDSRKREVKRKKEMQQQLF